MRIAGPDVVLFVIGLLLFSGSVYGLVATGAFEGDTSALGAYSLSWSEETEETTLTEFATENSAPFNFTINENGVLAVTVVVACQHAATTPPGVTTSVDVTLTGPNGLNGTGAGECGSPVTIDIPVDELPASGSAHADSPEAAVAEVTADVGKDALGEWSGEATFASSGSGTAVPGLVEWSGDVTLELTKAKGAATPMETR